jgi:para-nitrobenzyl esterase
MHLQKAVRLLAGVVFSFSLAGAFCASALAGAETSGSDPSIVTTEGGAIQGVVTKSYRRFSGIPYAAPPVGELRFVAPQPAKHWHGVRKATGVGHSCAQPADPVIYQFGSTYEDCLYLNVYTPYPAAAKPLPVMVWIHGGGYVTGTGADYLASGLSSKGQVIVVTINYRLGPFGFMAHPAFTAESAGASGNYGLLDQQAAIRWARRNAAAFGGDPSNITIFGESAGGGSVCSHLASPAMRGMFQRAIIESGPCTAPLYQSLQAAEAIGQGIASDNGCPTTAGADAAACLRALPVDTLIKSEGSVELTSSVSFFPAYGGPVFPMSPGDAIASGHFNRVPVMQGTNHDEGTMVVAPAYDLQGHPLTGDEYPDVIQTDFGGNAPLVLAQYPAGDYSVPGLALAAVFTDSFFACPALSTDQALAQQHNAIYAYEFADEDADSFFPTDAVSFPMGAFHGAETGYLFFNPLEHLDRKQRTLSDLMIGYWTHFAATGNPNFQGAPHWPRFSGNRSDILSLVPKASQVTTGFAADHQCAFWAGVPLQ